MKGTSLKTWQFWTWAICATLGFACLLLDRMWLFVGMLFMSASSWVLISREQYLAPVPRKQVVWILIGIAVFVILVVAQNLWWPNAKERGSGSEKWVQNPALIAPIWAVLVGVMFMHWRRSRRTSANT